MGIKNKKVMADCKLSTCRTFNMHLDAAKAIKLFFILNPF